jgi:hypothetical protein
MREAVKFVWKHDIVNVVARMTQYFWNLPVTLKRKVD